MSRFQRERVRRNPKRESDLYTRPKLRAIKPSSPFSSPFFEPNLTKSGLHVGTQDTR